MLQSQTDAYTFPTELDPSVQSFFTNCTLNEWSYENYKDFYLKNYTRIPNDSIVKLYQAELKKIIKNKSVPDEVKGRSGILMQSAKEKIKGKNKEQCVYTVKINTNQVTVFGDVSNNDDGERISKKQKFDHVNDESSTWNIHDQEDIWEAIRQYLNASISHDFCLERYHIIKCGYSIKCNPSIPTELLDHVQVENYTISTPFQTYSTYTTDVLKVMKTNDMDSIEKVVKGLKASENSSISFVKGFFKVCLWIYKKPKLYERLTLNETAFNHSFIWPIMEFIVDTVETPLTFYPAEYVLKAAQEETKVDACILDGDNELAVLETSGKILLNDNAKYGLDHIKVHYGALSIFNTIFKKYCTATEETATKLKIPFIHARHDTIHLWVLGLCSTGLYCSKKAYKSKVPEDMAASKDILTLANFCWCFREALLDAVLVTRRMKEEHEEYEVQKMLLSERDSRISLSTLLKLDICKPVMCADYTLLIPEEK